MEIYLIRHTTLHIEKGICYGQSDIDISSSFESELIPILEQVPKNIKIISSPLSRCRLLAQQISNNIVFDDRLKELNFGNWELKKWDDIPPTEINPWYNDFVNTPCKNGESYQQLFDRVKECFLEITTMNETSVGIVTHGGVIRSILAHLEGIPLHKSFDIKVGYGQVIPINI